MRAAVGKERRYAVESGEAREDGQHQRGDRGRDRRCRATGGGTLPAPPIDPRQPDLCCADAAGCRLLKLPWAAVTVPAALRLQSSASAVFFNFFSAPT